MTWPPCLCASVRDQTGAGSFGVSRRGAEPAIVMRACTMRLMENPHPLFSRATEPTCPNCGFSLNGLPESGACPECGGAYNPSSAFALIPPPLSHALRHLSAPIALAAIGVCFGIGFASSDGGAGGSFMFGLLWALAGVGCFVWGSWRATKLFGAIADARPPRAMTDSPTPALARAGMVIAFMATVCASGLFLLLLFMFGACAVTMA